VSARGSESVPRSDRGGLRPRCRADDSRDRCLANPQTPSRSRTWRYTFFPAIPAGRSTSFSVSGQMWQTIAISAAASAAASLHYTGHAQTLGHHGARSSSSRLPHIRMGHAFIASTTTCATASIESGDAQRDHAFISHSSMAITVVRTARDPLRREIGCLCMANTPCALSWVVRGSALCSRRGTPAAIRAVV
jgi:hypothetical protein